MFRPVGAEELSNLAKGEVYGYWRQQAEHCPDYVDDFTISRAFDITRGRLFNALHDGATERGTEITGTVLAFTP
jgi:hypothetical protein